jgi:lysophospholipase L1-like esterase
MTVKEILSNDMLARSRFVHGNQARLARKLKEAEAGGEITVAYLGGSITQGASAGAERCYAALTQNWLTKRYPAATFSYVNGGIGATGSYIGVHRVDEDILKHQPDIVFVEFTVNDIGGGEAHIIRNSQAYESLLRKIWHSPGKPAVITIAMTKEDGESFVEHHGKIVRHYNIPMISYREAVLPAIVTGHFPWTALSDDDIHPNELGHEVLAGLLIDFLKAVSLQRGEEDDFPPPITEDKYHDAIVCRPQEKTEETPPLCGIAAYAAPIPSDGYTVSAAVFGNIAGFWQVENRIAFAVKGRNIGIFYGKLADNSDGFAAGSFTAVKASVFVDGEKVAVLDTAFPGGWGDYVESEEVYESEVAMRHIVEIVVNEKQGKEREHSQSAQDDTQKIQEHFSKAKVIISGLAVS